MKSQRPNPMCRFPYFIKENIVLSQFWWKYKVLVITPEWNHLRIIKTTKCTVVSKPSTNYLNNEIYCYFDVSVSFTEYTLQHVGKYKESVSHRWVFQSSFMKYTMSCCGESCLWINIRGSSASTSKAFVEVNPNSSRIIQRALNGIRSTLNK